MPALSQVSPMSLWGQKFSGSHDIEKGWLWHEEKWLSVFLSICLPMIYLAHSIAVLLPIPHIHLAVCNPISSCTCVSIHPHATSIHPSIHPHIPSLSFPFPSCSYTLYPSIFRQRPSGEGTSERGAKSLAHVSYQPLHVAWQTAQKWNLPCGFLELHHLHPSLTLCPGFLQCHRALAFRPVFSWLFHNTLEFIHISRLFRGDQAHHLSSLQTRVRTHNLLQDLRNWWVLDQVPPPHWLQAMGSIGHQHTAPSSSPTSSPSAWGALIWAAAKLRFTGPNPTTYGGGRRGTGSHRSRGKALLPLPHSRSGVRRQMAWVALSQALHGTWGCWCSGVQDLGEHTVYPKLCPLGNRGGGDQRNWLVGYVGPSWGWSRCPKKSRALRHQGKSLA